MERQETVVVVDDEPDILDSVAALLAHTFPWLRILATQSPQVALGHAREGVDLLVTDYRMPQMDGLELARRAHEADSKLPILLVTAFQGGTIGEQAGAMGVGVLHKPLDPPAFLSAIQAFFPGPHHVPSTA